MAGGTVLIGCGRIGFLLENDPLRYKPCTHFGGAQAAGIKINYACDIQGKRLKQFTQLASIPPENSFLNYRDIFQAARPEMVIIATWTESHHIIGIDAAKNGARVIILEKPLTSDLKSGVKLIETCRKHNTKIIISHERRYDARYRRVKEMLRKGTIGDVKTVYASILTDNYRGSSSPGEGGGSLLQDGTHMVDILRFFFGEISTVEGEFQRSSRKKGFEDRAAAWLQTETGIDIFLESGGSRNYFQFELEISGTEGKIVIGNGYERLYKSGRSGYYTGFRDLKEIKFPAFKKSNCFINMYTEAAGLLRGRSKTVTSSVIDGYRSLEVIHAVYLSSYYNRKKIMLPLNPSTVNLKKIFNL